MVTLLAGIFIKDKENTSSPEVRQAYGMLTGIVGIFLNICLFAGKFIAGTISSSISITADAFNNLSDAGSSFVTLIGFKLAGAKPDPDHPFGHGRIEYVSGLIVSGVILLMAFELIKNSVDKIIHPTEVEFSLLAMGILVASILVKIYMYFYNQQISKKIDSAAMKATAVDSLSDTLATTVVLIAAIVANPNIPIAVNDIIMKSLKKDPNLRYQSATAMLIDLKRALKEPQGNFVDNNEYVDAPTQRISTIQDDNRGPKATAKKKENKFVAFVKKHKVLSTIVGLILLFVLSLGTTLGIANATRTKDVAIPNLVGKTVDEAKKLVQDSKLVYSEGEAEYSADVEAGKIISQNPKYTQNGTVKEKSEIKVIVSLGTEKTKVPKFVGTTKEEAEKSAKDAKLKLEFVEETSKTIESGYITKQETDEGTEVNAGDTVKVYISIGTGIKQVVVTSVLQKDVETAKKSLEEKGLVVEIEYTEDKTKDNGVVLNQSIKSGETVDEGSTITLTVNKIAETKTGTVTINVKSITGYQDKIKKPVTESVKGETTSTTIQKEVEVDNTPNTIQLKVTVDGETVTDEKVKENVTDKQVSVSGKGNVTIKVYIDGILKKTVDMNLNNTDKLTIE